MVNLKIGAKLNIAFLSVNLIFLIFATVAVNRIDAINGLLQQATNSLLPRITYTGNINTAFSDYRAEEANHILSTDAQAMKVSEKAMRQSLDDIEKYAAAYDALVSTPEERKLFDEFRGNFARYMEMSARTLEFSRHNDNDRAFEALRDSAPGFETTSTLLDRLEAAVQERADTATRDGNRIYVFSVRLVVGVAVAVIMIGFLAMRLLNRNIAEPLRRQSGLLVRLTRGEVDLTATDLNRRDEVGEVARAVAEIVTAQRLLTEDLRQLIDDTRSGLLSARLDPDRHQGEYARIVVGLNNLIATLTAPLTEVADVMQKMAAGHLGGRMSGAYEGELRAMRANVNRSLDGLVALLNEIAGTVDALAAGNFTGGIRGAYQGEFAAIKANFNQAITRLRDMVGEIAATTTQITAAAAQTHAAARMVAEETARQMTALTDLSTAVAQSAAGVTAIARHAETGRTLAAGTAQAAGDGRAALDRLAQNARRADGRQSDIAELCAKIATGADDAGLAAINAGLAAARGGPQAAAFGIVAEEVGRFGLDIAAAARAIADLVAEARRDGAADLAAAAAADAAVRSIAATAETNDAAAGVIAQAINEQAQGAAAIVAEIDHLRAAGKANAAAADQISASMSELDRLTHGVKAQLDHFILR